MSDNDAGPPAGTDPAENSAAIPALGDGLPLTADERAVAAESVPDFEVPAPPTFAAAPAIPESTVEVSPPSIPDAPDPFATASSEGAATRRAARSAEKMQSSAPPPPEPRSIPVDLPAPVGAASALGGAPSGLASASGAVPVATPTSFPESDAEAAGRASDESWARLSSFDAPNHSSEPAPHTYRGWTIGIFAGLAALLIGAIALLGFLASNAPLNLPDFGQDDDTTQSESAARGSSDSNAVPVAVTETCSEHCAEVASLVGDEIVGANDGVVWALASPWQTESFAEFGSEEEATGSYASDRGSVSVSVWSYPDDATAAAGLATLMTIWGEPVESDTVYEGGEGVRHSYADGTTSRVLWHVEGDKGRPWVMLLEGPDLNDTVFEFYLAMPI